MNAIILATLGSSSLRQIGINSCLGCGHVPFERGSRIIRRRRYLPKVNPEAPESGSVKVKLAETDRDWVLTCGELGKLAIEHLCFDVGRPKARGSDQHDVERHGARDDPCERS